LASHRGDAIAAYQHHRVLEDLLGAPRVPHGDDAPADQRHHSPGRLRGNLEAQVETGFDRLRQGVGGTERFDTRRTGTAFDSEPISTARPVGANGATYASQPSVNAT
jgi:hypothetical protein